MDIDTITATPAARDDRSVVGSRSVDIVVSGLLLAFALLMGWDNWRTGAAWASDGPQAGYFPFYLSILLGAASLWALFGALTGRADIVPAADSDLAPPGVVEPKAFVTRDQLRRVLQVLIPTILYVAATQYLGLYVASFLLVAGFMRVIGKLPLWTCLLTSFLFATAMFLTFEVAFNVIMPKGPLEAAFGY